MYVLVYVLARVLMSGSTNFSDVSVLQELLRSSKARIYLIAFWLQQSVQIKLK